jgi:hypothetical protein
MEGKRRGGGRERAGERKREGEKRGKRDTFGLTSAKSTQTSSRKKGACMKKTGVRV